MQPPDAWLRPCEPPAFTVEVWGDYPVYVEQLLLALQHCNADKAALSQMLTDRI